jgi:hypothetical protein
VSNIWTVVAVAVFGYGGFRHEPLNTAATAMSTVGATATSTVVATATVIVE